MKKQTQNIYLLLILLALVLISCRLLGPAQPSEDALSESVAQTVAALAGEEPAVTGSDVDTLTETTLTPSVTEADPGSLPAGTETPGVVELSGGGQIAFFNGDTLFRYLIGSGDILPVESGLERSLPKFYGGHFVQFSPCGRYLALTLDLRSTIYDLVTGESHSIQHLGDFFAWQGEGTQFYAVWGRFIEACDIERLDEQDRIVFEILLMDMENLENPTTVATVPGGLQFLRDISLDGAYASVLLCGCSSSCGSHYLWQLSTLDVISSPLELDFEDYAFSPDNQRIVVSRHHNFGYFDSPLYIANRDFSELREIFYQIDVVPLRKLWSPDSGWIAFNALHFSSETWEETNGCVMLVRSDGAQVIEVACGFSELAAWSPNGGQLLYSLADTFWVYDLAEGSHTPLPFEVDGSARMVDWGSLP